MGHVIFNFEKSIWGREVNFIVFVLFLSLLRVHPTDWVADWDFPSSPLWVSHLTTCDACKTGRVAGAPTVTEQQIEIAK